MLIPGNKLVSEPLPTAPRALGVFGSTGSIGCSTLDLIRVNPGIAKIFCLVAGRQLEKLCQQVQEFRPRYAAVSDPELLAELPALRKRYDLGTTEFLAGDDAICSLARDGELSVMLASIVGIAGLRSVIAALECGKTVALANKESLVCAGDLVKRIQAKSGAVILPVDSEHSAIFQALQGERLNDVTRLILTASGGPFLRTPLAELPRITPEQAVRHPRWNMGAKISIDSATMMNKALEVIEAGWLYGFGSEKIDVLIHPQSIIHSLVDFRDGTQMAQLSLPDMKGPIAYALSYPYGRLERVGEVLDLAKVGQLDFLPLDDSRFPAISLARQTMQAGGAASAVLNIVNELAVAAFVTGSITFDKIVLTVSEGIARYGNMRYSSLDDLLGIEEMIRRDLRLT